MANKAEETLVYVLLFPNPFEKNNEEMLGKDIIVSDALEQFLRIYKSSSNDEEKNAIPYISQKKILWLTDALTDEGKTAKIYVRDFLIGVVSSMLYSISQEIGLRYELLQSRDKDEIFCKIYAKEKWLIAKAEEIDYKLSFRSDENDKLDFMRISPFGSINLLKEKGNSKLFKTYDENGDIKEGGSLFTYPDKARLVIDALNKRFDLASLTNYGVLLSGFCIHQDRPLAQLKYSWARLGALFSRQPFDAIRLYFSEKIAIYFEWIGVYSHFMFLAAGIGLVIQITEMILSDTSNEKSTVNQVLTVTFSIFLCFWASVFDQYWIRKEKFLAWKWGTTNLCEDELQRGSFKGEFAKDEVTGKMKIIENDNFKKKIRKVLSYSVILGFVLVLISVVTSIFILRYTLRSFDETTSRVAGGIINALQIRIMNIIYGKLASSLNNWENHETENLYNDNLAVKLFLFKFINSYASLFYIAFFKQSIEGCDGSCMGDLSLQLLIIFVTNLFLNVFELSMPWLKIKMKIRAEDKKIKEAMEKDKTIREVLYEVEQESKLETYESPLDDYMEMAIQYGYVALFGASVPYLPLLALIEILLEIRVDAWKLCLLTKRPDPNRSEDIGVWKHILIAIAYAGALSNAGIIFITSGIFDSHSLFDKILGFITLEHFLLLGMYLINIIIPDFPIIVTNGLNWSKRIAEEKKLNWKVGLNIKAEFNTSRGDEKFLLHLEDFNYQL